MKRIKQIFNILSTIVFLPILAFLLIAAPMILGNKPVMVLSGSMEPAYHVGSIIYYKQTPFEEIEVGDPITYYAGDDGALVTHRVIEKQDLSREFVTQGDANNSPDPNPVNYDRVAGKASGFCIPYAGYFVAYCKQLPVIITLGGILVFNILLDMIFPDKKKDDEASAA